MNLASRLEGQCKTYVVGVIVGENTAKQIADFATPELDLVMVKGKTEPARMHPLLGDATMAQLPVYRELMERQAESLRLSRAGAFAEALDLIDGLNGAAAATGWKQGYYDMMRERIDGLIDDSPPDWNGVYVAKEK